MTKRYKKIIVTPDGLQEVGTTLMDDAKAEEANKQPATNGYSVMYEEVKKGQQANGDSIRHEG